MKIVTTVEVSGKNANNITVTKTPDVNNIKSKGRNNPKIN